MTPPGATHPDPLRRLAALARRASGLELLVLHGSRARGDEHGASDWDLAFAADAAADPAFDPDAYLADAVLALGTDSVDLAPLAGASGLFRFRVARDANVIFEKRPGTFDRFWMDAVRFWCDAEPVMRPGLESVLAAYR